MLTIEKGFNQKNEKDIYIIRFDNRISKDENQNLRDNGVYYSSFLKAYVSYKEVTEDLVISYLNEESPSKKEPKSAVSSKVEYKKMLFDYISKDEYIKYLDNYYNDFEKLPRFAKFRHSTIEQDIQEYKKEVLDNFDRTLKYNKGELSLGYIREAIVIKSLGLSVEDMDTNGNKSYYRAIWDLLPVIKDLKIDRSKSYTASWGYDQTNIDIAYELNKKVWGFDVVIVPTNFNNIMFVRIKRDEKDYFAFHDKVRYFKVDKTPLKTFEQDASQTGHYR